MRLITFGKVHLSGCTFSRPKPLLLLAYLTLEGSQERRRLAALFWRDSDPSADRSGLQKKLGKLSVVLAQFRKEGAGEVFPATPGLDPLVGQVTCDTLEFLAALEQGKLEQAVSLYQGPFLHSLSKSLAGLELSGEFLDWVLETRETLAQKVQEAMLELAERALGEGSAAEARNLAERAYTLAEAPELEPRLLSRFQHVLFETNSVLLEQLDHLAAANLDELPDGARQVFLALAIQEGPNLTVLRAALKLSISELAEAQEVLISAGLVTPDAEVLTPELARHRLMAHPREAVPLTLALARATPAEGALNLYRRVYTQTHGFGGAGDLAKARAAYCQRAKSLSNALEFAEAAALLGELHGVERVLEADPDPESRFLAGYALERMGRYKEALATLQVSPEDAHNPDITALLSVLLWRRGKSEEARVAAEKALESGLDWLWARASAHNTLGGLAYAGENFLEAASYFKKAAALFQSCGEGSRYVGSLNNYANALNTMADTEARKGADDATVKRLKDDAENAYQIALEALEQTGKNEILRARILLNIGMLWEYRKDWDKAEKYYLEALPSAESVGDLEARLYLNLGNVYFIRQNCSETRKYYHRAISLSAQIGDFFVQGAAAANLANLDNDPNGMEVALELLEQSGNQEQLSFFEENYEEILKIRLKEALVQNDAGKARLLFTKLGVLYKKQLQIHKANKIEDALGVLTHSTDSDQRKALLLALLQERNGSTFPPN